MPCRAMASRSDPASRPLDVEMSVGLRKRQKLTGPRIETTDWLISVGAKESGKFEDTLSLATRDMLRWLVEEHKLTAQEAHLLIGLRARYDVITVGGSIGLRIARSDLP